MLSKEGEKNKVLGVLQRIPPLSP